MRVAVVVGLVGMLAAANPGTGAFAGSVDGQVVGNPLGVGLTLSATSVEQGQVFTANGSVTNWSGSPLSSATLGVRAGDGLLVLDGAERLLGTLAGGATVQQAFSLCPSAAGNYVVVVEARAVTSVGTWFAAETLASTVVASPSDRVCGGFAFDGFLDPVDNPPTQNIAKAGRAVPLKFSLGGYQGVGVIAAGYPKSVRVDCSTGATVDPIETTTSTGTNSLSYDALTDTYAYVWGTERAWAGTCRQLILMLTDGSLHRADFQFRR